MPSFFAGMEAAEIMLRRSVGSPETTEGTSRISGFPASTSFAADQELSKVEDNSCYQKIIVITNPQKMFCLNS